LTDSEEGSYDERPDATSGSVKDDALYGMDFA